MKGQRLVLLLVASACLCALAVATTTKRERSEDELRQYIRKTDNYHGDRINQHDDRLLKKKGRNATLTYVPKGYVHEGDYPFHLREAEEEPRGRPEERYRSGGESEGDLPRQHYGRDEPPQYGYSDEADAFEHDWPQWAQSATHRGYLPVKGQRLDREFLRFVYDPLAYDEIDAEYGQLLVHYATPLTKKGSKNVYMMVKDPRSRFDAEDFSTQTWGMTAFAPNCEKGTYDRLWTTWVDWKAPGNLYSWWEPVFHGAFSGDFLYVPAAKGGVHKIDPDTGAILHTYNPFPNFPATERYFTTSPLTVDKQGQIYYTVVAFADPTWPFSDDVLGSWLVVIPTQPGAYGAEAQVSVADITTMAALPSSGQCVVGFASGDQLPWPPSANAPPSTAACGKLRAGLNAAPAVADDGTVVFVARAHGSSRTAFIIALRPDLTVKWASSLLERLTDGCGVPIAEGGSLPPNGAPGGCREGTRRGVDPATNTLGSGRVNDQGSASPVIAPDGSIFYGAYTRYNYDQGHLMKFSPEGEYLTAYSFGWDTTPGIYIHEAPYGYGDDHRGQPRYSLVTKDNHYGVGSYCDDNTYCPPERPSDDPEAYWISQLSPDLKVEWQWLATNTESCVRNPNNTLTCVSDHPNGFEWCVNAPAIDKDGTVYVNSEDGWLYKIAQGGILVDKVFQQQALGAAYTPASLDPEGLILTQNTGTLFIIGETLCGEEGDKHY